MNEMLGETEKQYVTTNQVIKGVMDYLAAKKIDEAARLYSHCQEDVGYMIMVKAPQERPFQASLGRMFYISKDYEKAAQVLENMGESKKAAELYEATDQYEHAAEMWAKEGDHNRAAHMYEKCGSWQVAADLYTQNKNYERAAYCFEKAVNNFLAGKYYFHIKKFQKSMELLQKICTDESDYLDATVMIGNILAMHGYLDIALAKYRVVTRTIALSKESLSVYYNLAQLLEKNDEVFEAMKAYKEVAGIDFGYKEVSERIKALEEKMADSVETVDAQGHEDLEVIEDLEPVEEEVMAAAGAHPQAPQTQARIVSVMEGFEFLKNTSLFERLTLAEMKRMWNTCDTRQFQPGEVLIEQDQPGKALFVVKRANVVVQRVEGEAVKTLVELGPGSHVGEMSLVDDAPTSARVVAGAEGTEAFEITREKFDELLDSDDKIAIKVYKVFIKTMCDRLRKTTAELSAMKA